MIELGLLLLVLGDWIFTNRENIAFAVECEQTRWIKKENV
jgi:hypothetical protein